MRERSNGVLMLLEGLRVLRVGFKISRNSSVRMGMLEANKYVFLAALIVDNTAKSLKILR